MNRIVGFRGSLAVLTLAFALLLQVGCSTPKGPSTEAKLAASGFKVVPAATPVQ